MRLLHTTTCELQEFPYDKLPEYAILSHRWENVEVTFADLQERKRLVAHGEWLLSTTNKEKAWAKVYNACKFARENDFDWLWLDMCCIDKTSSAELQEAINSMFAWYRDATLCVAYLNDVPNLATEDPKLEGSQLRKSVWFTRGWTLQELIAPNASIEFLSKDWTYLGCRDGLAEVIAEITNVDVSLLSVQTDDSQERLDFSRWSVATRMSWAANRTTSRPEDQAYSLAGFFDVSMSISYGE
ncbi:HET-domain-containing protein, partial [Trametes versicolor FP-101664 SS1]|uniref:HET-domain-containing protein n=1 Tax=Trametes versicolor (strain FP-101664) TaxID=717944 RepID=UPI0004621834